MLAAHSDLYNQTYRYRRLMLAQFPDPEEFLTEHDRLAVLAIRRSEGEAILALELTSLRRWLMSTPRRKGAPHDLRAAHYDPEQRRPRSSASSNLPGAGKTTALCVAAQSLRRCAEVGFAGASVNVIRRVVRGGADRRLQGIDALEFGAGQNQRPVHTCGSRPENVASGQATGRSQVRLAGAVSAHCGSS